MFKRLVLPLVVLAALLTLYFWGALKWSYSTGERAGWVQKFSDKGWVCKTWEGELALVELHRQVIDNILGKRNPEEFLMYTRDPAEAVRLVDGAAGLAAFFLDAPDLKLVLKLAQEGKTLPQKSTYFHPKPPSGMVLLELKQDLHL